MKTAPSLSKLAAMIGLIVIVCAVYAPGLTGPFVFDDVGNILRNPSIKMDELSIEHLIEAALAADGSQSVQRPLSRASFALNYYLAGQTFDRVSFKAVNLAIHVFNALLVAALASLLLASLRDKKAVLASPTFQQKYWNWLPVAVATLWALHPIQLTSVLYVVQRMNSLSGTMVLLGLVFFVVGRRRLSHDGPYGLTMMISAVALGSAAGIACKENAALLPLYAGVVELFFFRRDTLSQSARQRLKICYGVLIATMILVALALLTVSSEFILRIYEARNFTPLERVLTQSRVHFLYLGLLLFPRLQDYTLFHDDLFLSHGLFEPISTAWAVSGVVVLLAIAVAGVRRRQILAFAIAWYFVGHAIESTILGLELVHEHRNYLPSFGVLFAVCYYAMRLIDLKENVGRLVGFVGLIGILVFSFVTYARATLWGSQDTLIELQVRNHPKSYRSQMAYGALLQVQSGDILAIYRAYQTAADLNRENALPVMRMQRYVAGILNQFADGSLTQDSSEGVPETPDLYRDPLYMTNEYMRVLDTQLADEISRRLTHYAIDAETTIGLDELRQCVGSKFPTCPPSSRIEAWLELVLQRDIFPNQRVAMLLTLARLRQYDGKVDDAIALMEEAVDLTVDDAGVWIEMISMYLESGRHEQASRLLAQVEPEVERTGRRISDFRKLKSMLAEIDTESADEP